MIWYCKPLDALRALVILSKQGGGTLFPAMRVTVIGTGYVGTVTGACLAYLGHHVTCVDTDASKIARLQRGESPIYEPQLEQLMALAAERGGLHFTTEIASAVRSSDVIFIAVGTPPL